MGTLVAGPARSLLDAQAGLPDSEMQKGDPQLEYETINYSAAGIQQLNTQNNVGTRGTLEQWRADWPKEMLKKARTFVGKTSRVKTPEKISEFLELFNLKSKGADGTDVPFCAAGLTYCALLTYADLVSPGYPVAKRMDTLRKLAPEIDHYYFYPTVACKSMWFVAQGKSQWKAKQPNLIPRSGWIALFDWENRVAHEPNHCGIVEAADAMSLSTIEFNTSSTSERNGGAVEAKLRNYNNVIGYIVTDIKPGAPGTL